MSVFKQQTLSFNVRGEEITSRPFDFEAMCLMNDVHMQGNKGKYSICANAIPYLFEGTKVTEETLKNAEISEIGVLCDSLWELYIETMKEIQTASGQKNAQRPAED